MEFLKGETDPVGDCGNFAAGIDVHGADQFPGDSKKRTWYSRIECYGNTAEHADELRDKVLALLVTTEHDGELHKAVFMALESYGGADTFRDGVLAMVQQSKDRGADLDRVTAERDAALGRETALREDNSVQVSRRESALNRCEEMQQRLAAADERAEVLEGLLRRVIESSVLIFEQDAPETLESLEADICAALKPAEGGGDEA